MSKQVPWNKVIVEEFISLASLTKEEEMVLRTRASGWTRTNAVTAATAITLQMYVNGVPVSGATASATPSAAGEIVNITLPWIFKKGCCCDPSSVTFVLSGAGAVNSATVKVEKI